MEQWSDTEGAKSGTKQIYLSGAKLNGRIDSLPCIGTRLKLVMPY